MIVVAEHRNQYYGRSRAYGPARFKEVNCRDFESRGGLVETRSSSCKKPVTKRAFSGSLSPKTRSPLTSLPVNTVKSFSEDQKKSRKPASPFNLKVDVGSRNDEFRFSELWAGPAYSNSPPLVLCRYPNFLSGLKGVSLLNCLVQHPILICVPSPSLHQHPQQGSPSPGIVLDSTDSATKTQP